MRCIVRKLGQVAHPGHRCIPLAFGLFAELALQLSHVDHFVAKVDRVLDSTRLRIGPGEDFQNLSRDIQAEVAAVEIFFREPAYRLARFCEDALLHYSDLKS